MRAYLDDCQQECQRLENLIRAVRTAVYSDEPHCIHAAREVLDTALADAGMLCAKLDVVNRPEMGEAA